MYSRIVRPAFRSPRIQSVSGQARTNFVRSTVGSTASRSLLAIGLVCGAGLALSTLRSEEAEASASPQVETK